MQYYISENRLGTVSKCGFQLICIAFSPNLIFIFSKNQAIGSYETKQKTLYLGLFRTPKGVTRALRGLKGYRKYQLGLHKEMISKNDIICRTTSSSVDL